MKRRTFIAGLGATAAWPLVARGQQPPKVPVVGFLSPNSPSATTAYVAAFLEGLGESGYVAGRNVAIEYRWAEGQNDRLPALAADLVRQQMAVIVPGGGPAALAVKAATATIPIVFQLGNDPVELGLVASLNRPGGNVTGVTNVTVGLGTKRLDLMHELVPGTAVIGILGDKIPTLAPQLADLQQGARALGLQLAFLSASNPGEIDAAFADFQKRKIGAIVLADIATFNGWREQIVAIAARYAIPTMYTFREFAIAGGLMSYASSLTANFRQVGIYVGRILRGEQPGTLPVQQPTKFEFVINLKTAKALGLTVSPSLLAIADEVIE